MRITCFATNTPDRPLAEIELRHRLRARAEDRIQAARSTGLRNLPLQMAERGKPWTFVASGAPLREDVLVRTDAASVEQCLAVCLPRLRELGFSFPK